MELRADIAKGATVRWEDVIMDESLSQALELRRETEALVAEAAVSVLTPPSPPPGAALRTTKSSRVTEPDSFQ